MRATRAMRNRWYRPRKRPGPLCGPGARLQWQGLDANTVIVESLGALIGQPVGSVEDPRSLASHDEAASEDHCGRNTPGEQPKVGETQKDMSDVDPRPDRQEP